MTDIKQPPRRSRTKAAAPSGTAVPHFTPTERAAQGKAARTELPRSAHAIPGRAGGGRSLDSTSSKDFNGD
jgi:hypothetical protein